MAFKPSNRKPDKMPAKPPSVADDSAIRSLSLSDRKKLGMDSWEPTLLRKLLTAQNRLRSRD